MGAHPIKCVVAAIPIQLKERFYDSDDSDAPMNIALVCNEYPPRPQGGIGTFTYYFARALFQRGHSVTVVGLWERDTETDDHGIRVVTRRCADQTINSHDRRRFAEWLEHDVATGGTSIVEVPDYDGLLPFPFAACPVIVRLHQSASGIAFNRLRVPRPAVYWRERENLRQHANWIGVSRFVLDYTRRIFRVRPQNSEVIYNFAPPIVGPDTEAIQSLRNRFGDFVLFVGKLTEAKGALDLARAARRFLSANPTLRLVYVGRDLPRRGVMMSELIRGTLGEALAERVHFTGPLPHCEVLAWMAAARAFIQPSHLEAFSVTALEAIQCGVPILITRRASGPELVETGRTGLIIDPSDPVGLAAAVDRVFAHPREARQMVLSAAEVAGARFGIDQCVARTLQFYAKAKSCSRQRF